MARETFVYARAPSDAALQVRRPMPNRAGGATPFSFIHAFPLTLLAAGAGWLFLSVRNSGPRARRYPRLASLPAPSAWESAREQVDGLAQRAGTALGKAREVVEDRALQLEAHVANRIEDFGKDVIQSAERLQTQFTELGHDAYDTMERTGHRAREVLAHEGRRAVEFGRQRPVELGLFALAAGIATAFLLGKRTPARPAYS